MIRRTLSREDNVYKAFPDLARCDDGSLVCIYRESLRHSAKPFGRIACHISRDGGRNWSVKRIIHDHPDHTVQDRLNNPRILHLGGLDLYMICDLIPGDEPEHIPDSHIVSWRSHDGGETWDGPEDTGITGHICPCLFRKRDGTIIIGTDDVGDSSQPDDAWYVNAFFSTNGGQSFDKAVLVAHDPDRWLNECSFVELDDGTLVCYIREDRERLRAFKTISTDGGQNWSSPTPTYMTCCVGRPKAGILASGEVVIFYGFQGNSPPRNLVMHVESQAIAADPDCVANLSSRHTDGHRYFFVDHDRSPHPDGAYSSWVQLPSGEIFAVQYINDDAPMAHIRSYQIAREDWVLSPEGSVINDSPSPEGFHPRVLERTTHAFQSARASRRA
ncbi:MAG: sialidase family protein [Candidatus Latescibacterota bacterium]|nr:sialidase family protein [Candidatus Latescibacterota bacterium]